MRFTLTINCDGEAFSELPGTEVARLLQRTAEHALTGHTEGILLDVNGNSVGTWAFTEADEDHQPTKVVDDDGDVWRRDAAGRWWCGVDDSIDINDGDEVEAYSWLYRDTLAELQSDFGIRAVLA